MPHLHILAGPNGAGKTTAAFSLLPNYLAANEFVNADEIARGLSPLDPESVAIQAGRLMIERIRSLVSAKQDFAFETTLASRSLMKLLKNCKENGYSTNLLYVWLRRPELSVARVAQRVNQGGHHVPEEVIRRRYAASRRNFFTMIPLLDKWAIYENHVTLKRIAEGDEVTQRVYNENLWREFRI